MEELNSLVERLFKAAAEDQIKVSYTRYQNFYKSASMDYADVCQEIKMEILKSVQKTELLAMDFPTQCKYVGASVRNSLNTILDNSNKVELAQGLLAFADDLSKSDEMIMRDLKVRMEDEDEKQINIMLDILRLKFIAHRSEREIGKALGIDYNKVRTIYETCLRRYSQNKARKMNNERFNHLLADYDDRSDEDSMEDCVDLGTIDVQSVSVKPENDAFFLIIKAHLTDFEFQVIELTYKNQLEVRDIAEVLNSSKSTVSRALQSALGKLKRKMKNFGTE